MCAARARSGSGWGPLDPRRTPCRGVSAADSRYSEAALPYYGCKSFLYVRRTATVGISSNRIPDATLTLLVRAHSIGEIITVCS